MTGLSGIYFWEANPDRAFEWALRHASRRAREGRVVEPFVVGVVIDPGFCLDMASSNGLHTVESAYIDFRAIYSTSNISMPANIGGEDHLMRRLDCAVINYLHRTRARSGKSSFDTVRGIFIEGEHLYPHSGFRRQTHTQICVRNQDAIKGVFRVPERHFTQTA